MPLQTGLLGLEAPPEVVRAIRGVDVDMRLPEAPTSQGDRHGTGGGGAVIERVEWRMYAPWPQEPREPGNRA